MCVCLGDRMFYDTTLCLLPVERDEASKQGWSACIWLDSSHLYLNHLSLCTCIQTLREGVRIHWVIWQILTNPWPEITTSICLLPSVWHAMECVLAEPCYKMECDVNCMELSPIHWVWQLGQWLGVITSIKTDKTDRHPSLQGWPAPLSSQICLAIEGTAMTWDFVFFVFALKLLPLSKRNK